MLVKDLISVLMRVNPEASIIIHRDAQNYGFGSIESIKFGLFLETDYGGDFFPDQELIINPDEIAAVCFYPEEYLVSKDKDYIS